MRAAFSPIPPPITRFTSTKRSAQSGGSPQSIDANIANVTQIAAADITGNKLPDLFVLAPEDGNLYWYENLGNDTYQQHYVVMGCATKHRCIIPVDYMGRADLLVSEWSDEDDYGVISIWENSGGGLIPYTENPGGEGERFIPPPPETTFTKRVLFAGDFYKGITEMAAGDIDSVGGIDVVCAKPGKEVFYLEHIVPKPVMDGPDINGGPVDGGVVNDVERHFVPQMISYKCPETLSSLMVLDYDGNSYADIAMITDDGPARLTVHLNDGGGTFTPVENPLGAARMRQVVPVSIIEDVWERLVIVQDAVDFMVLDVNKTSVTWLKNESEQIQQPRLSHFAYVANTVEPTYTLSGKTKSFKLWVRNIAWLETATLTRDTVLRFGNGSAQYEAHLRLSGGIGPEQAGGLDFEEAEVPLLPPGEYEVTIELVREVQDHLQRFLVLPEKIHISPETLVVSESPPYENSPVLVRGECDFEDIDVLADGTILVAGSEIAARNVQIAGRMVGQETEELIDETLLTRGWLRVLEGGYISLDGGGYKRCPWGGPGVGQDAPDNCGAGGGGHATPGQNGDAPGQPLGGGTGGTSYLITDPTTFWGSAGGSVWLKGCDRSALGGAGGGDLYINVHDFLENNGRISANGLNGEISTDNRGSGGGAGGRMRIQCHSKIIRGTGTYEVRGGKGGQGPYVVKGGDGGEGYFTPPEIAYGTIVEYEDGVFTVFKAEVTEISFTNDEQMYNNADPDEWGVGQAISDPVWKKDNDPEDNGPATYPCKRDGVRQHVVMSVKVKVYTPLPEGTIGTLIFSSRQLLGGGKYVPLDSGEVMVEAIQTSNPLQDHVHEMVPAEIDWKIRIGTTDVPAGASSHRIYVTLAPSRQQVETEEDDAPDEGGDVVFLDPPKPNQLTEKRISRTIERAYLTWESDEESIADRVQNWLSGVTIATTGTNRTDDWMLLKESDYWGECVEQATLMARALCLIGIHAQSLQLKASDDTHCLNFDKRRCPWEPPHEPPQYQESEILLFDFKHHPTPPEDPADWWWNEGEGTCRIGGIDGIYYSVEPALKGVTAGGVRGDLSLLRKLVPKTATQWWTWRKPDGTRGHCKYETSPAPPP